MPSQKVQEVNINQSSFLIENSNLIYSITVNFSNDFILFVQYTGLVFFGSKATNVSQLARRINGRDVKDDAANISTRRKEITLQETLLLPRKGPYKFGRLR